MDSNWVAELGLQAYGNVLIWHQCGPGLDLEEKRKERKKRERNWIAQYKRETGPLPDTAYKHLNRSIEIPKLIENMKISLHDLGFRKYQYLWHKGNRNWKDQKTGRVWSCGGEGSGPKTGNQSRTHLVDIFLLMGSAVHSGGQLREHGLTWLALRRRHSVETKKELPLVAAGLTTTGPSHIPFPPPSKTNDMDLRPPSPLKLSSTFVFLFLFAPCSCPSPRNLNSSSLFYSFLLKQVKFVSV